MTEIVCSDVMTAPQLRRLFELGAAVAQAVVAFPKAYERLPGNTGSDIPVRTTAAAWKAKLDDGLAKLATADNALTTPQLVWQNILDDFHCQAMNTTWLLATLPEVVSVNAPAVAARKALEIEWSRQTGQPVPVVPADAASPPGSRKTTFLVLAGTAITTIGLGAVLALSCRRPTKKKGRR